MHKRDDEEISSPVPYVRNNAFPQPHSEQDELISYILQQEQQRLEDIILNSPPEEVILNVLLDILENKKLYYNLFVAKVPDELQRLLQDTCNSFFTNILSVCKAEGVQLACETLPPLVAFYTTGVVGMIMWWTETDFSMPAEEVTSCLSSLLGYLWE